MPLHLTMLEKIGLFLLNRGPSPMIDLLGVLSFKAVMTALRLKLFDILGNAGKTVPEIASAIGADITGITLLLGALDNLGYVAKHRDTYVNTAATKKWLLRDSPDTIADMFFQFDDMSQRWDYLDKSIRSGYPPEMGYQWLDHHPGKWRPYHAGLMNTAVLISRELMKHIELPAESGTILDLGGSHGQYCIEFCHRYPSYSGIVFDWASAEQTALENIASHGLSDRVTFTAGDFMSGPIGSGYNIILMFNTIRIFTADELRPLFKKIFDALQPSGRFIIMDHLGHRPSSRLTRANTYLVLLEIFNSTKGKTHSAADVSRWLKETGFAAVKDFSLKHSPGLGVLTAVKR